VESTAVPDFPFKAHDDLFLPRVNALDPLKDAQRAQD
jgi:hypothetical protein